MTHTNDQDARYRKAAEEFGPAMQRLARATEANAARQHDLLQDMHVALWQSLARFDGRCSLSTWVYRVTHNVAADHVRRERRQWRGLVALDTVGHMPDGRSVSAEREQADALARIHAWIRKLGPPDRQVMLLYLEQISAADIANITGLTPGAVATRISRLKSRLASDFKETSHD
jgi:RNA polymerase sigma-70 factor (ECF subfamily)